MKNTARGLLAATTAALIAITPAGPAAASLQTHTVVRGDTLSEIAYDHGVSLRSVFKANRMGMDTIIYPGQRIRVPGSKTTSETSVESSSQAPAPSTSAPSIGSFVPPPHGERSPIAFPTPGSVQQAIIDKAKAMGADPALAQATGWQESNYREHVVSYAGAIGCRRCGGGPVFDPRAVRPIPRWSASPA